MSRANTPQHRGVIVDPLPDPHRGLIEFLSNGLRIHPLLTLFMEQAQKSYFQFLIRDVRTVGTRSTVVIE